MLCFWPLGWGEWVVSWSHSNKDLCVLVAQSCLTLCNPLDFSPPDSSVLGILQAGMLEWVAMPSSRGSSQPMERTQVSCTPGRFFTIWATKKAQTRIRIRPNPCCHQSPKLQAGERDSQPLLLHPEQISRVSEFWVPFPGKQQSRCQPVLECAPPRWFHPTRITTARQCLPESSFGEYLAHCDPQGSATQPSRHWSDRFWC